VGSERDIMPASPEAERSLLGSILLRNEHFYDDCVELRVDDFSLDSHRKIYSAMNLILCGDLEDVHVVDLITLSEVLRKQRGGVEAIGGVAYLSSLTEGLPRRPSIAEYVSIVREKSKLRRLIHMANHVRRRAEGQDESYSTIAADLQDQLVIEDADTEGGAVRIGEVIPKVRAQVEAGRKIAEGKVAGLTWGLSKLDALTYGAHMGEMTVIAAAPGGFKTAFAAQMLLANGREGVPCCFHSIEMPEDKLTRRFFPAMGDFVKAEHMREPRLMNIEHMMELDRLSQELAKLPIWIDDTAQDIRKLLARMRMMRRKHKIKLFAIDYFQLIHNSQTKTDIERYQKNALMLRDAMKNDLGDCHLLVLSQFSKNKGRGKSQRSGDDLYGGTALHHATQNMIIIAAESGKDKEPGQFLDAELDIDKMREGGRRKHSCQIDPDFLRFQYSVPYDQQQSAFGGMK
jgi:replicative DNA helicase